MSERDDLLASIAHTIRDYRSGEIAVPTPAHVDRWVRQFNAGVQLPMLREMNHVLGHAYGPFEDFVKFLEFLVGASPLAGKNPRAFWREAACLDIQGGGNSQTEMLALLDELVRKKFGFGIRRQVDGASEFIYLDDAIFTGNRVRRDIEAWIAGKAPKTATLHIISIVLHNGAEYYAGGRIGDAAAAAGKKIDVKWWCLTQLEDRKSYSDSADVLRPTTIPDDPAVQAYVAGMRYPPTLRSPGNVGSAGLFSSEAGKNLLEQEFLKAGVRIRQACPNLGATQRPLGHMTLDTLGFGSPIVTFRNCPNNAPLALWVGDPWYPLFPRTTNSQTAMKRMFEELTGGAA